MLLCRCDSDHAEFITSVLDPRDHEYVLGATKDVLPFAEALEVAKAMGQDYLVAKQEWKESAGLKTFDELVKENTSGKEFDLYKAAVSEKIHSLAARKTLAKRIVGKDLNFDWELPRTPLGQYMFQWSTKVVIERAILAAPLGDVSWSRQDKPSTSFAYGLLRGLIADSVVVQTNMICMSSTTACVRSSRTAFLHSDIPEHTTLSRQDIVKPKLNLSLKISRSWVTSGKSNQSGQHKD